MLRNLRRFGKFEKPRNTPISLRKIHTLSIEAQAETEKAFCHKYGLSCVPQDTEKCIYHYSNACYLGSHVAMNNIGVLYHEKGDHAKAKNYFSMAIQTGSSVSNINWASYLLSNKLITPATNCYRRSMNMGNDMGMVLYANEIRKRNELSVRTINDIYTLASESGNPYAKYMLAYQNRGNRTLIRQLCEEIKQSSRDTIKMQPYYEELTSSAMKYYYVESGSEEATKLYENAMKDLHMGNHGTCVESLIKAKDMGSTQAMFQLGTMYQNGIMGKPDPHKAHMTRMKGWYLGYLNLTEKLLK